MSLIWVIWGIPILKRPGHEFQFRSINNHFKKRFGAGFGPVGQSARPLCRSGQSRSDAREDLLRLLRRPRRSHGNPRRTQTRIQLRQAYPQVHLKSKLLILKKIDYLIFFFLLKFFFKNKINFFK